MTLTIGSLCSGVGGLDLAVERVFGAEPAWFCEFDESPARVLAHRWPGAPNHRDLKTVDWSSVAEVDVLTGGYPCFTADALVLTRDGYRPISDIAVGDLVLTHERRWRPVTALMSKTADRTVVVSAQGTQNVQCTVDHPWWTQEGEWVDAADLRGRRVVQALPEPEPGESPLTTALLWVLGRHLADGYVQDRNDRATGGRVTITCAHEETDEVLAGLKSAGLHGYVHRDRTATKVAITRNDFYDLAASCGRGAAGKRVPGWLLAQIDADQAAALLAGYLSGDGYRDTKRRAWTASTVSKALALGMALVAQRARGVVCSIRLNPVPPKKTIEGRVVNQRPFWKLTVPDRNRSGRVDGDLAYKLCRKVVPAGEATVYNIAVDEDESYVVDNAVVHNCQPFSAAGRRLGTDDPRHLWPFIAEGIASLQPRWCVFENVAGHLTLGFDVVMASLAQLGYSVRWHTNRASDIGAPHGRRRVFIVACREPWPLPVGAKPVACLEGDVWVDLNHGLFGSIPYTGRWPWSGAVADGVAYRVDAGQGQLSGNTGLLPTPRVAATRTSRGAALRKHSRSAPSLEQAVELAGGVLPREFTDADDLPRSWSLLPTPTASDADKERSNPSQARRHSPPLSAVSALFPTPQASDGNGGKNAAHVGGTRPSGAKRSVGLTDVPKLLPTPRTSDTNGAGRHGDGGLDLRTAVAEAVAWGKYAPAIARWEQVLGRPAPAPTEPNSNGNPRLSARFAEWLMGWPDGWVTDPQIWLGEREYIEKKKAGYTPTEARNAQLKAIGNGVVDRQAEAALLTIFNDYGVVYR